MPHIVNHEYSSAQKKVYSKAKILVLISLLYSSSICIILFLVMGHSQTMWTNFVESIFNIFPPIIFLASNYTCTKPHNKRYPYGYHKIITLAFFATAFTLFVFGIYLFQSAIMVLINQEHPTIGLMSVAGRDIWQGWIMMSVMVFTIPISMTLSRLKEKLAYPLNDKVLFNNAKMNKADWMTNLASVAGVFGVGYGIWWLDAVAAALVSLDILFDGSSQLRNSMNELMDCSPKSLDGQFLDLPEQIKKVLVGHKKIQRAEVCLREVGHVFCGEGFITLKDADHISIDELKALNKEIKKLDWRLNNFFVILT